MVLTGSKSDSAEASCVIPTKFCDSDDIVRALECGGQVAGYTGNVWFPQPAPRDHPWRTRELSD